MEEINLSLFNHEEKENVEVAFMDAFADFSQDFLFKFEGISLICLNLERSRAIGLVKKIWAEYSFIFYKTLTSGTKRQSISVLYALIQMANLSSVIANDLIQNFNFNLNLKTPWSISRSKCTMMTYPYEAYIKDYDTRSLFILFVCTLLRKSEVHPRIQFLSLGANIISQVFSGLEKDAESIQNIFLETLSKYVLDPDAVPRNSKIAILSVKNLEKIAMLPNSYTFLKNSCAIPGKGVCYKDMGWYPPEKENVKVYNKILSDFIPTLKVLKVEEHKNLLLEILRNCPELVKGYVSKLNILPIDQFLHQDWEKAMEIITEIVNLPVPQDFGGAMFLPPPVTGFVDSIIPSCFSAAISSKGLQHSNPAIRSKVAQVLCFGLAKLEKVVTQLLARSSNSDKSEWSDCVDSLLDIIQKRIPVWQVIILYHHSSTSDEFEGHLECKRYAYRLIFYYQKFFSDWIEDSKFNFGKLICPKMCSLPLDIQYCFLEILQNGKEFKWWVVGESGESYLKKLFEYFISCKDREIQEAALESVLSCLSNSILFHKNSDYAHILLSVLQSSSKFEQEYVVEFLDKSICDSEKYLPRFNSLKVKFESLEWPLPEKVSTSHFCLYWLGKSLEQTLESGYPEPKPLLKFFARLILEHLYSIEEEGDNLYYLGSTIAKNLDSKIGVKDLMNSLSDSLNTVASLNKCMNDNILALPASKRKNEFSFKDFNVSNDSEIINLFVKYDLLEIIDAVTNERVRLSPELIHELVSQMCMRFPSSQNIFYSKLAPALIHVLPHSFLFEYAVQITDLKPLINRITEISNSRILRFIFTHSILRLNSAIDGVKSEDVIPLCSSILSHTIQRSSSLNCLDELMSCKSWKNLLLKAFDLSFYSNLLKKDVFTNSILNVTTQLLQIDNSYLEEFLGEICDTIKSQFLCEMGSSFPNVADSEILGFLKFATNPETRFEILDEAHSRLSFDNFCWILEVLFSNQKLDSFPSRYLILIIQKCISSPSQRYLEILDRILNSEPRIEAPFQNAFKTKTTVVERELLAQFFPVLADHLSVKLKSIAAFFIGYYPRQLAPLVSGLKIQNLDHETTVMLLDYVMHSCCSTFDSWKENIDIQIKNSMRMLWQKVDDHVVSDILEMLFGRKEYDQNLLFIYKSCSFLLMKSSNIIPLIAAGIPLMSFNSSTLTTLVDLLPVLDEIPEMIQSLLCILLRILRGYLISMKEKASKFGVENVANALRLLSKSIISDVNEMPLDKELRKYIRNFAITVLKSYFDDFELISCVNVLWHLSLSSDLEFFPARQFLEMIITHSKFNTLMISNDAELENIQLQLSSLIINIMEKDPTNLCDTKYLEKIIPVYQGTMNASDRTLLAVFGLYEARLGVSTLGWIQNEWTNRGNGDIMLSLDAGRMIQTITDFPMDHDIEDILCDGFTAISLSTKPYYLYDISFLIPFAASLLFSAGNPIDLTLFIKSNLLGIVVMGMSSKSEKTRNASSAILHQFHNLLFSSKVKERDFLIILFDSLKNAIVTEAKVAPRVPSIISYFVAQASVVLLNPESIMYPLINRFLLQRPILDFKDIPMFYELIYSSSEFNRYERIWLLKVLSCSIIDEDDYFILKRRHAIDILFGVYCSSIGDAQLKSMILEILYKASMRKHVSKTIITKSSLLTFLHSASIKADFSKMEDSTLCLPSLLVSFGKLCSEMAEKSNNFSSSLSSILTTMSFYMRQLLEVFHTLESKNIAYSLLNHIFNLVNELGGFPRHRSIFSSHDVKKIIHIVESFEEQKQNYTEEKAVIPSRILIQELLPDEHLPNKRCLRISSAQWVFCEITVGLESDGFIDILCWVSLIVVKEVSLYEKFGKWLISCRLANTKQSFKSICHGTEWEEFMKILYEICSSKNEKFAATIYPTLLMLIIRDLEYETDEILDLVTKIPSPRQIEQQPCHQIIFENKELVLDLLREILWKS